MKGQSAARPLSGRDGNILSRRSLLILAIYSLLTLLLTYPLIVNLTTAVPNDIGDPLLNTWILAWDTHALLTDPLNLFNANIFHPLPNTLAYSEHLISTALLALPLQLFFGEPILTYAPESKAAVEYRALAEEIIKNWALLDEIEALAEEINNDDRY